MNKRPSEMSVEELEALPTGPHQRVRRDITEEDRARGIHGRYVEQMVWRDVLAGHYREDDLIGFRDRQGQAYTFGQWADGSWFKTPALF